MSVYKDCRGKGCKHGDHRCDHPWAMSFMHNKRRHRMLVNDFAFARGAVESVTSKQEAKSWERKFIDEIQSGKDPRNPAPVEATLTVAAFIREVH